MQTYTYKARDAAGKLIQGSLTAENEIELSSQLSKSGYYLTFARVSSSQAGKTGAKRAHRINTLNASELLNFTTQLAISLDAGITLLAALRDLAGAAPSKKVKAVVENIANNVESGRSLKDALSDYSRSFPKLYTSIIGAGESTGKLPFVLGDLAKLLEWQEELKSKVKEASIYPIILFTTMIMVVLVLVIVVIPKFKPMFDDLGVALPLPTQVVLAISDLAAGYWWVGLLAIIGGVVGYKVVNSQEKGQYLLAKWKLRIPVVGVLMEKIALSRFCHTFALGLRSGVNVFAALGIASEVTGNKYFETLIVKARDYVNVGEKISTALQMSGKFPYLVVRMIGVGEQTGTLSETLEKVNQYYDKEVPAAVRGLFAMFEPLMIVTMGVVVGGIALSVFLPLTSVVSKVGG